MALPGSAVLESEFTREGGRRAMASLLRSNARGEVPTAVLALADVCAVGALAALRERGVRVPEEISLAGFDDIPLAEDLSLPLSTVRIPLTLMGAEAVRLALRSPADTVGSFDAPVQVVLRATTGAPRR
ncbi:hypothetical protein GCM10020229_18760 [Kitasatospora albolonga]|uniref:substrate-binding domain-containing protein n=1 Tax=Kitasatospora albolonga TaxID=68173 RepID=UPI0031E71240